MGRGICFCVRQAISLEVLAKKAGVTAKIDLTNNNLRLYSDFLIVIELCKQTKKRKGMLIWVKKRSIEGLLFLW